MDFKLMRLIIRPLRPRWRQIWHQYILCHVLVKSVPGNQTEQRLDNLYIFIVKVLINLDFTIASHDLLHVDFSLGVLWDLGCDFQRRLDSIRVLIIAVLYLYRMFFWLNNGREIHINFLFDYFWSIFFYAKPDRLIVEYIFDLHFILTDFLHLLLA